MDGEEATITERVLGLVEYVALGIETFAVLVIAGSIIYAAVSYVLTSRERRAAGRQVFGRFRERLGQALLVGLELLVAADIIRTVALDSTFQSIGMLGLLVVIRTFLSWSLEVELEGRWPWQGGGNGAGESAPAETA